jgi:hypothetical protein
MNKRISKSTREMIKERNGIILSTYKTKKCKNCFYMNHPGNVCSKHFIKVSLAEICSEYNPKSHKFYLGGGVSPR